MVNFDREQMRRIANNMPEQYDAKPPVQQAAQIINGVFSQLLATFPAEPANRDQNELNEIRRQWVLAFREKRDHHDGTGWRRECAQPVGRIDHSRHHPAVCCRCREKASGYRRAAKTPASWLIWFYEHCRKRGLYPDAESYPWKSNAHYWLVTNLLPEHAGHRAYWMRNYGVKLPMNWTCMTARINRGSEAIPEPVQKTTSCHGR